MCFLLLPTSFVSASFVVVNVQWNWYEFPSVRVFWIWGERSLNHEFHLFLVGRTIFCWHSHDSPPNSKFQQLKTKQPISYVMRDVRFETEFEIESSFSESPLQFSLAYNTKSNQESIETQNKVGSNIKTKPCRAWYSRSYIQKWHCQLSTIPSEDRTEQKEARFLRSSSVSLSGLLSLRWSLPTTMQAFLYNNQLFKMFKSITWIALKCERSNSGMSNPHLLPLMIKIPYRSQMIQQTIKTIEAPVPEEKSLI